jgi:hypothetical protein
VTKQTCTCCYAATVPPARAALGYHTCLACGEKAASKVRHTIVPMAKSNYVVVTDPALLKGLNKYVPT